MRLATVAVQAILVGSLLFVVWILRGAIRELARRDVRAENVAARRGRCAVMRPSPQQPKRRQL